MQKPPRTPCRDLPQDPPIRQDERPSPASSGTTYVKIGSHIIHISNDWALRCGNCSAALPLVIRGMGRSTALARMMPLIALYNAHADLGGSDRLLASSLRSTAATTSASTIVHGPERARPPGRVSLPAKCPAAIAPTQSSPGCQHLQLQPHALSPAGMLARL